MEGDGLFDSRASWGYRSKNKFECNLAEVSVTRDIYRDTLCN